MKTNFFSAAKTSLIVLNLVETMTNRKLVKHLKDAGFTPAKFTPSLFKHTTIHISCSLMVDDFGVKYINKEDAEY